MELGEQLASQLNQAHKTLATSTAGPEVVDDAKGSPASQKSRQAERMPKAEIVGIFWGVSELLVTALKRSKSNAVSKDRHSIAIIWLVNLAAIALGIVAAYKLSSCRILWPDTSLRIGYCSFVSGLILRWYSIIYLGRFFTANVAIANDHRVIDTGPYRFIRHPSYTGSLLMVMGFVLTFQNWASILIIFVPSCAVTLWRIHIEEEALTSGLGKTYKDYMARTKRLIPLIY